MHISHYKNTKLLMAQTTESSPLFVNWAIKMFASQINPTSTRLERLERNCTSSSKRICAHQFLNKIQFRVNAIHLLHLAATGTLGGRFLFLQTLIALSVEDFDPESCQS
mmetsp:Transcript_6415/g.7339  ORF Transcript_6415/g.7339 Transcript_6415/m.7339 type:complete len:109 (-) Transcript_6415:852-1178(-)